MSDTQPKVLRMALTFGTDYENGVHPRLGELADPRGYIVVEAPADTYYQFLDVVVGRSGGEPTGPYAYAFDYPADEFENGRDGQPSQVARWGYRKLAEFSALPKVAA